MEYVFPVGIYLYASPDDELGIIEAREYIEKNGYTNKDVSIVKRENQICVKTKVPFTTGFKPQG